MHAVRVVLTVMISALHKPSFVRFTNGSMYLGGLSHVIAQIWSLVVDWFVCVRFTDSVCMSLFVS